MRQLLGDVAQIRVFRSNIAKLRKCPGCQEQARIKKNTDPPGRPTAAQRGYGAEWRRASAKVIAAVACHWCGGQFTADDPATADHVIPKARGGTSDEQNLVGAHRSCNSRRGGQMRKKDAQASDLRFYKRGA
jgi:5-methylcytosine-specific restriction endonuclease McrA